MSTTILVKCVTSTDLQWQESGTNEWKQLSSNPDKAPVIDVVSDRDVTFEFRKDASSNHGVDYKACSTCAVVEVYQQSGPSLTKSPGSGQIVYFAQHQNSATQQWYAGHVKVSRPNR